MAASHRASFRAITGKNIERLTDGRRERHRQRPTILPETAAANLMRLLADVEHLRQQKLVLGINPPLFWPSAATVAGVHRGETLSLCAQ